MTTRDDARRTASEPPTEGLRLVPPRPEPSHVDPDRLPDRDRGSDGSGGPERDGDRSPGSGRGPALPERLYAARERKGVDLYRAERDTKIVVHEVAPAAISGGSDAGPRDDRGGRA